MKKLSIFLAALALAEPSAHLPLGVGPQRPIQAEPDTRSAAARAAKRADQELVLARSNAPYFVVDVPEQALRLKLRGVEMRTYKLLSVEAGTTLFGPADAEWMDTVYDLETRPILDRMEIKPPPEGAETANPAPALPPETEPEAAPRSFTVTCGPHLSLRITSEDRGVWGAVSERFVDWGSGWRAVRLRLKMSAEDAQAFYRSWPTDSKLIIVPPAR